MVTDTLGNITAAWLENGNFGTMSEAAYYATQTGAWTVPTVIDQDNGSVTEPRLVVDQFGIVTAAWLEYLGGSYQVQAARFDGTTWTSPVTLDNGTQSPHAYLFFAPIMVVDNAGNVTVLWIEQPGSMNMVQVARFANGTWTTSPTTLGSNMNANVSPSLVVDGQGNVTALWLEQQGSTYAVQAARCSNGTWGAITTLDGATPNAYGNTTLKMIVDALGNVTATWLEHVGSALAIEVARFSANSWTPAAILDNNGTPNASSSASLVVDSLGNVTAAWLENTIAGTVAEASYYAIQTGTWTTPPTIIDQDNAAAIQPQLIVDQSGIVTAVWLEYAGGSYQVQAARFNGTSWTSPVLLDNGTQSPNASYANPSMVVDELGNVTVIWIEQQGSTYAIQAARCVAGVWTSSPTTLDGPTPNLHTDFPAQIVVDPFGNVTVVWVENVGSSLEIQAARFDDAWTPAMILNNGIQSPNAWPYYTSLQTIVDPYGNVTVTWMENSTNPVSIQVARFSGPIITGVSPQYGPITGGTSVIITGTGFTGTSAINFGSVPATSFIVHSDLQITAISPAHAVGTADITVISSGLTSATSSTDQFTFQNLPPANLTGYQLANRFLLQLEYVNILSWNAPSAAQPPITTYRVYRDAGLTDLAGTVPYTGAQQQLPFLDHNRQQGVTYSYYIVSIDAQGHASAPASIIVSPIS